MPYDSNGQPLAASFLDYTLPTAERVPRTTPILVELPAADGPFGAKGVGEPPVIGAPAAIANAVADAIGARLTTWPITSDGVRAGLTKRSTSPSRASTSV
jgi:CO/xanthine dehydrogenase Mo-binding subunit